MSIPLTKSQVLADSCPVSHIRVVVQSQNGTPQWSDNHWSMYFIIEQGLKSVRSNMTADPEFIDGELEWTELMYTVSTSSIKFWDLAVRPGITVRHLSSLIYSGKYDQYEMSGGGSGCRYWVWTMLNVFATHRNERWISNDEVQSLGPELLYHYHMNNTKFPSKMLAGTFNR